MNNNINDFDWIYKCVFDDATNEEKPIVTEYIKLGKLSIIIDGIRFSIVSINEHSKAVKIRVSENIENKKKENFIIVFRSSTETSLWSLCVVGNYQTMSIYHGCNNKSNMIDLRLQVFINQQIRYRYGLIQHESLKEMYNLWNNRKILMYLKDTERIVDLPDLKLDEEVQTVSTTTFLKNNYSIRVDSCSHTGGSIPQTTFRFDDDTELKMDAEFYSVELFSKDKTKINLKLYFMKYNLEFKTEKKEDMLAPVLLTPVDAKISIYGTYNRVVNDGNYICNNVQEWKKYSSYFNDRYKSLWPMSELTYPNNKIHTNVVIEEYIGIDDNRDFFTRFKRFLCENPIVSINKLHSDGNVYDVFVKNHQHTPFTIGLKKKIASGAYGDVYDTTVQVNIGNTYLEGNIVVKIVTEDTRESLEREYLDWDNKNFCESDCKFIPIHTSKNLILPQENNGEPQMMMIFMLKAAGDITGLFKDQNFQTPQMFKVYQQIRDQILCLTQLKPPKYYGDLKPQNVAYLDAKNLEVFLIDIDSMNTDILGDITATFPPYIHFPETLEGLIHITDYVHQQLMQMQTYLMGVLLLHIICKDEFIYHLRYDDKATKPTYNDRHVRDDITTRLDGKRPDIINYVTNLILEPGQYIIGENNEKKLLLSLNL